MVRRQQREFWVGFIGGGDISKENAADLLDNQFFPQDLNPSDFHILLPKDIKRTQKGLMTVKAVIEDLGLEIFDDESYPPRDLVNLLIQTAEDNENVPVFLVVLWDGTEQTEDRVRQAIAGGVAVKDLCAALDDIEIGEEPEPEPKQHGKPRVPAEGRVTTSTQETTIEYNVVPATVNGPASIPLSGMRPEELLGMAFRQIFHEEAAKMGLTIGHNARQTDKAPEDDETLVKVFVSDDGEYELAGERKRAPRGKKAAEITRAEARQADLL